MIRTLKWSNGIALLITITVNYLSNTGMINNMTVGEVSANYQNYFTPAGYAFSIWGFIYLLLLGFVIYQWRGTLNDKTIDTDIERIGWWFVISCLANCGWLIAWLYEYTGISVLLILTLLLTLLGIIVRLNINNKTVSLQKRVFITWPFSVYAGWVTVAVIANMAAWLTSTSWNRWNIAETNWTIIMIAVAMLINLFMVVRRNMYVYALSGIWALIAIANRNEAGPIVRASFITAAALLAVCIIHYFNRKVVTAHERRN